MYKNQNTIISVVVTICLFFFVATFSKINSLGQKAENQWIQIESNLKVRCDNLIPNLIKSVKLYTANADRVCDDVEKECDNLARALQGGNIEEISEANRRLDNSIGVLLAIAESYPDFRATEPFYTINSNLKLTENNVDRLRKKYNDAVWEYNSYIRSFPANIVCILFGYTDLKYYPLHSVASAA